jgi:hypothetical protein
MSIHCMYELEPIGVGGKLEACNVLRFCSIYCRDKYHADPNAGHILAYYGGPINRIFEEGEESVCFLETDLILLAKGEEKTAGCDGEVCNQCGVVLE